MRSEISEALLHTLDPHPEEQVVASATTCVSKDGQGLRSWPCFETRGGAARRRAPQREGQRRFFFSAGKRWRSVKKSGHGSLVSTSRRWRRLSMRKWSARTASDNSSQASGVDTEASGSARVE